MLPLRSATTESRWPSLEARVRQIESQKGSFRTVSEKSLREDMEKAASGTAEVASESEDDEDDEETPEMKQKKLWEAREEMMRQLLRAQNETLTALDSISLLLSGYPKAPASKSSMSPALAAAVPVSTLGAQKVRKAQLSTAVKQQSESLYLGYKLDSLNKAIEKVNTATTRLGDQAKNESAFWKQVADLSVQGLVVSRLPRDSRTIGVHFGFAEAAPKFRNRGFAVLRTDQDGNLRLDQAIASSKKYSVQVSIYQRSKLTGRSRVPARTSSNSELADTIADLRRSLFEEELFYELGREARAIANQGVAIMGQTITANIKKGHRMVIELVDQDPHDMSTESEGDKFANGILLCLRGLLSKGHEQSLARRSQPPAPLVPKAPTVSEYALLRPLMSHIGHQSVVSGLQGHYDLLKATMNTAGLLFNMTTAYNMTNTPNEDEKPHHELFLDALLAPADTKFEISLPTGQLFELTIRTHLAPPAFGTVFTAASITYRSETSTPPKMSNLGEVKSVLCQVLTNNIVELIMKAQSSDASNPNRWKSSGSHCGELKSLDSSLYVKMEHASLLLRCHNHEDPKSPVQDATWVWCGDQISNAGAGIRELNESHHLIEIVSQLSSREISPVSRP